jgi:hypothetical protein
MEARKKAESCYEARFEEDTLVDYTLTGHTKREWITRDFLDGRVQVRFGSGNPDYRDVALEYANLIKERHPHLREPTEGEMREYHRTHERAAQLSSKGHAWNNSVWINNAYWDDLFKIAARLWTE